MNTDQLYNLVRELVDDEDRLTLTERLNALEEALGALTSNPHDDDNQATVARAISELSEVMADLEASYLPATMERLTDIGVRPYFTHAMVDRIRQSMADNPMTPTIAHQEVEALLAERNEKLETLRSLYLGLPLLALDSEEGELPEAQLGFRIPRAIFKNELEGFSRELHQIQLIIRAFSEAAGNTGESVEIRQISTTDPLVYVAAAFATVKLFGGAVKWCLDQWKTLEEIRHVRAQTAALQGAPTANAIVEMFDKVLQETLDNAVKGEAQRLATGLDGDAGRRNEVKTHLEKALMALLSRMERGLTVEIRLIAPPEPNDQTDDAANEEAIKAFDELAQIQQQLVFPKSAGAPVLRLSAVPDPEKRTRKVRSQSGGNSEGDGAVNLD